MSRAFALFDFDGTLTRGDSLIPFLRFVCGGPGLAVATVASLPHLAGYAMKLVPNWIAKERLLTASLAGRSRSDLEAAGRRFADEVIPAMLRPDMMDRMRAHRESGMACVLVSASLDLYLGPWASAVGFDHLICSSLAYEGDIATGRLAGTNCYGPEKVRRLEEWLAGHGTRGQCVAYGDSPGDMPMLDLADEGWWIRKRGIERHQRR